MRSALIFSIAVAAIIIGAVVFSNVTKAPDGGSDGPQKLPEVLALEFINYQDEPVALTDLLGTPLVINAWASWCPFCVAELPDFATVQAELGDQVVFVAINRAESLRTAKKFTDDLGVSEDMLFLLDPKESFYKAIGGFSMPETLFINAEGNIITHKRGFMTLEEIRDRTTDLVTHNP